MKMHARDAAGDWLPAAVPSDCLSGPEAVPQLIRDRLKLFTREWWEDPAYGNPILELLRSRRVTEADLPQIANLLASYVQETEQVVSVSDVHASLTGREILFSCRALTAYGGAENVSMTL